MSAKDENKIILYQDENGITNVTVRFSGEDLWLTQNQIAEIYAATQQNVSQHVDGIFRDRELLVGATHKKFLLVQAIASHKRKVLQDSGKISHKQAIEKAEKEFEIYRAREMKQLESDFDRAIKLLPKKNMGGRQR